MISPRSTRYVLNNSMSDEENSFETESFLPADVPMGKDTNNRSKATVFRISHDFHLPIHIRPVFVLTGFCASVFLHVRGLVAFSEVDGRFLTMLGGVLGSGLEGVLIINLVIALILKRRLWANAIAFIISVLSVIFLLVSVEFMEKTGLPDLPDMFVIISGVKESRSFIKGEAANDTRAFIFSILEACAYSGPAALLIWRERHRRNKDGEFKNEGTVIVDRAEQRHRTVNFFIVLFMANAAFYCANAWMPIFHTYASLCGSFFFSPPGSSDDFASIMLKDASGAKNINLPKGSNSTSPSDRPNLILLIHESLSGEYTIAREAAVPLMPFFQKSFQSNDGEFFVFENSRTVSGDTADAVTAITTGCAPLDHGNGRSAALSTNMATQAKMRGYETVSFSSRALNMANTKWFMIQNQLSTNFDQVWNPKGTGEPLVNEAAQSDRLMGKHFQEWIHERKERDEEGKKPFFAQFYYFDAHYPFFKDKEAVGNRTSNRLDGMLMTVDKALEDIFDYLKDAGELNNTVIIASGDHGEYANNKGNFMRLHTWNKHVLHPLTYMYMPKRLSGEHPEILQNLKHNRHQLVSTLDLYPTMLNVLDGISSKRHYDGTDALCVRGYDLLSKKLDSDRVAWSIPGIMFDFSKDTKGNIAIHYGTDSSLYFKFGWPKKNGISILKYDDIIRSPAFVNETAKGAVFTIKEWQNIIEVAKGSDSEPVVGSKGTFMKKLMGALERRSMGKAAKANTKAKTDRPVPEE